jgi:hypothetical protein
MQNAKSRTQNETLKYSLRAFFLPNFREAGIFSAFAFGDCVKRSAFSLERS